jgi:type I restriction enzyme M protein
MNERITENIVRDHFKNDPLFSSIKLEEQKSYSKRISELLQTASKSGKGIGKPEFIVSFPAGNMDYLLVIECKASITQHRSQHLDSPKDYAVDGVLHYASKLSSQYDVVAIAVSGQTEQELVVANFVWKKSASVYKELKTDAKLLSINDYIQFFTNQQFTDNLKTIDIVKKAIYLNDEYQAYSITETTRCTMVSAILLALINSSFRASYKLANSATELGDSILNAIKHELNKHQVKSQSAMIGEYQKIRNELLFTQETIKHNKQKVAEKTVKVVKEMIEYLDRNVYPLTQMEQNGFDVLGRFYTEFIRYAGSEQSQGLVLTPFHITDLFCDLAEINKHSVVYDPCTGTGGFLIAAMKRMFEKAGSDNQQIAHIKESQLIGTELRPSMFTYACSNMMLRGDGKSNIYCGSCYDLETTIKNEHKPDAAFLNPPYDVGTAGQMQFIEHALNVVAPQNGTVVAIVQMSCAIKNEKELIAIKQRILQKHHLVAVLSMPDDLFYPVGVVTCVMVFKANTINAGRKTWFGYFKDDGFEKRKQRGRIDARAKWKSVKQKWVNAYLNKDEVSGLSIKQEVKASDEWCAEAYMETDYSQLSEADFIGKMNDYIAFKFLNGVEDASAIE